MPTSSSSPATYSAALRSPGPESSPKLEVSIRIRSRHSSTTSVSGVVPRASSAMSRACHGGPLAMQEGGGGDAGEGVLFAIVPAHSSGWRNWQTR